jgi:hypothetical protein
VGRKIPSSHKPIPQQSGQSGLDFFQAIENMQIFSPGRCDQEKVSGALTQFEPLDAPE